MSMPYRRRPLAEYGAEPRDLDQGIGDIGFDELMIVNPGTPEDERVVSFRRCAQPRGAPRARAASRFLMGADGVLYEVIE